MKLLKFKGVNNAQSQTRTLDRTSIGPYGEGTTFRRTPKGGTSIIKKADMSKVEWSPAQVAQRQRMKEAIAYAQAVLADPERKKAYAKRAKRKKRRAYDEALSEYLRSFKEEARKAELAAQFEP